jgi:hypothetical protein
MTVRKLLKSHPGDPLLIKTLTEVAAKLAISKQKVYIYLYMIIH